MDLQALLAKSNAAIGQNKRNDGITNFTQVPTDMKGYKLFYPLQGSKTSLRIFYNLKSESIFRGIERHQYTLPNTFLVKAPCLKSFYEMDCPICNAVQTIVDAKGKDAMGEKYKFTKRFIMFAYINSIEGMPKDSDIKAGDFVLLMLPRTVAEEVTNIVKNCKTLEDLNKFFNSNNSLSFTISVDKQISTSMYKFMPDALMGQTKLFDTPDGDQKFVELMNNFPSLNDIFISSEFSQNSLDLAKEVADELSRTYLNGSVEVAAINNIDGEARAAEALKSAEATVNQVNNIINEVTQPQPQPIIPQPVQPTSTPSVTPQPVQPTEQTASSTPACMGQYNELEAKCLICANSVECSTKSINK